MDKFLLDLTEINGVWHFTPLSHSIRNKYNNCPLQAVAYLRGVSTFSTLFNIGRRLGLYDFQILKIIAAADNCVFSSLFDREFRQELINVLKI